MYCLFAAIKLHLIWTIMRKYVSLLLFALAILNPICATASNETPSDIPCSAIGPSPDAVLCELVNEVGYERTPIISEIEILAPNSPNLNTANLASVVYPYVNEYGIRFEVAINFTTGVWEVTNETGSFAGGVLEQVTLLALKEATIGLKNNTATEPQLKFWRELIGWVIDGIGILIDYDSGPSEGDIERQEAIDTQTCANRISHGIATSIRDAAIHCVASSEVRDDGRICQNVPRFSGNIVSDNPEACFGRVYQGCDKVCN
jgi:hypothetical protein